MPDVPLRSIPPDFRAALLPIADGRAAALLPDGPVLRLVNPFLKPNAPTYLLLGGHDTKVDVRTSQPSDSSWLVDHCSDALTQCGPGREHAPFLTIMCALAACDEAFRDLGLYDGNIYLANNAAVAQAVEDFPLARHAAMDADRLEHELRVLQGLELIYRFPSALRFSGEYGGWLQIRLNGWGRRLVARLRSDGHAIDYDEGKAALTARLETERNAYRELLHKLPTPERFPERTLKMTNDFGVSLAVLT
jgi:hypothetical protein